jgi:hypothetical protein
LNSNLAATFTVAQGARVRPLTYISVQPRGVRPAYGGGYEMFLTAFQPVADLSVGGTTLREGTMRATASAVTGPWTFDYTTSLIFDLWPDTSGWHKFSAENLVAVPTP